MSLEIPQKGQGVVPPPESGHKLSRRKFLIGAGAAAAGTALIALGIDNISIPGVASDGESNNGGTNVGPNGGGEQGPSTINNVHEFNPGEAIFSAENLPNNLQEIVLADAKPMNMVVRKGANMEVIGCYSEGDVTRIVCLIEDPLRKDQNGQNIKFTAILEDQITPDKKRDGQVSFSDLLQVNQGHYRAGDKTITLGDGKTGKIKTIDGEELTQIKDRSGLFFVDKDPIRKDHPLHAKPLIGNPDISILPEGGSAEQLPDGRVVTKDSEGKIVARAISQRGLEWRWTKKEHLINDYSMSELADAAELTIGAHAFYGNFRSPEWQEAFLSVANKVRIDSPLWNKTQFKPNIDWKTIFANWDGVLQQFKNGEIPYESDVFYQVGVDAVGEMLDFAEKYNLPVVGSKLFWFGDFRDELKSNQYTPDQKKKMVEYMAKAKVLKYKGRIHEWTVAPELIYNELWAPADAKQVLATLGGRQIFHDAHRWVKEVSPDTKTTFVEDRLLDANYAPNVDYQKRVFGLLNKVKEKGTPLDIVSPENNFWIYAPPVADDMESVLERIESMGFQIGMAQTTIEESEKCSTAGIDRPRTVPSDQDKDGMQARVLVDVLKVYGKKGKNRECGLFSIDDASGWFGPAAKSQILGDGFSPKPAYLQGVEALKTLI